MFFPHFFKHLKLNEEKDEKNTKKLKKLQEVEVVCHSSYRYVLWCEEQDL
jgi:hypothetical protein